MKFIKIPQKSRDFHFFAPQCVSGCFHKKTGVDTVVELRSQLRVFGTVVDKIAVWYVPYNENPFPYTHYCALPEFAVPVGGGHQTAHSSSSQESRGSKQYDIA